MERHRNKVGRWYDRFPGRLLPSSRLLAVLFCAVLNGVIYWTAQMVTAGQPMLDMTTTLDEMIPVVPGWVLVYLLAFPFWGICYVLLARGEDWYAIMTAEVVAKLICGVFFLLLPTTNVRPLLGDDFFSKILGIVYERDAASNLFPSIHCLESWICFAGLWRRKKIPLWVRLSVLLASLLICLSTVLIRQHVLVDVFAGILLAEGLLRLSWNRHMGAFLERWFQCLDRKLLGNIPGRNEKTDTM